MSWSNPSFEGLADLLATRTGLVFAPDRRAGAELGIRRAMARAGETGPATYRRRVAAEPDLLDDLVVELTVGETYFFREPGQFEFLRRTALPEIRRRRGDGHAIRAWSAGCASGEEAYSLAMLLDREGLAGPIPVLATDISRAALAKARRAVYTDWSLRGDGSAAARPYLRSEGGRHVVVEAIRHRVVFESLNLALDAYPSYATGTCGIDLILCRNVLIYLDPETVRAVARRLLACLAEGGWLVVASSDPPLAELAPFEVVVAEQGLFYRRPATATVATVPAPGGAIHSASFPHEGGGPGWGTSEPPGARPLAPAPSTPHPDPLPRGGRERESSARNGVGQSRGKPRPPEPQGGRRSGGPAPGGAARPERDEALAAAIAEARDDLARGDYGRASERTRGLDRDAEAAAVHVRALANLDPARAEHACIAALGIHPFSAELSHLRAVLLVSLGRDAEAARAARRVIYLDRSLAIAHFLLGSILCRGGDRAGAWRAFRNAHDLCAALPPEAPLPLSDGEPAGRLADASARQMARLATPTEPPP
jgi:chemotaxis protein methyltransferase CheR